MDTVTRMSAVISIDGDLITTEYAVSDGGDVSTSRYHHRSDGGVIVWHDDDGGNSSTERLSVDEFAGDIQALSARDGVSTADRLAVLRVIEEWIPELTPEIRLTREYICGGGNASLR